MIRRLLSYDNSQLLKVFNHDFPQLAIMAEESENAELFG